MLPGKATEYACAWSLTGNALLSVDLLFSNPLILYLHQEQVYSKVNHHCTPQS